MADEDLQPLDEPEGIAEIELLAEEDLADTQTEDPGVLDPTWGALVDTVDTTGDGFADIELRDADGDGQVDYVVGDINNDGITDTALQDTDADGLLDSGVGQENWENLSGISDMDVDWIDRDSPELDSDHDGVTNLAEHDLGLDPLGQDSDGDNLEDGWELGQGSDPGDWSDTVPAETQAWEAQLEVESAVDTAWSEAGSDAGLDTSYDAGLDTSYDAGSTE